MDISLASQYTLQGDLLSIITANTGLVKSRDSAWLAHQAWSTLLALAETSTPSSVKDMPIRGLFLGESMPEKVFMDILDIFFRMGDVQMTGLLACLVELDRRSEFRCLGLSISWTPIDPLCSHSSFQTTALAQIFSVSW